MTQRFDETTDPALQSFVPLAADTDFPIQNLPYGVFSSDDGRTSIGVRIGDFVLDLTLLEQQGLISAGAAARDVFAQPALNRFMSLGRGAWREIRKQVSELLRAETSTLRDKPHLREAALMSIGRCRMQLPAQIGNYTDFYSSREHATNVGTMFRGKENALMPNWLWIPIGYHGRASSIVVSGTPVRRPMGQTRGAQDERPQFAATRELDFELELGFFVGPGNPLGRPITIDEAQDHIFGLALVNDWSARDLQRWE
ncbi:MAG: fumarylacetoacetate hydrolase family protein, partial [Deltaproteobacteria bacterium]|nr:fumarylacetoacetate hydrolase family protein [Deltaproteobacteria bacterium]